MFRKTALPATPMAIISLLALVGMALPIDASRAGTTPVASDAPPSASSAEAFLSPLPPITTFARLDYPDLSRRLDEEGRVRVSFWIDSSGEPQRCSVVTSSGYPKLDDATCAAVVSMRFKNPNTQVAGPYSISLNWTLDDGDDGSPFARRIPDTTRGINKTNTGELPEGRRVNLGLYLDVTPDGTVKRCVVRWSSGVNLLDKRACAIAMNWRYQPLPGEETLKAHREIETFFFADPAAPIPISKLAP